MGGGKRRADRTGQRQSRRQCGAVEMLLSDLQARNRGSPPSFLYYYSLYLSSLLPLSLVYFVQLSPASPPCSFYLLYLLSIELRPVLLSFTPLRSRFILS